MCVYLRRSEVGILVHTALLSRCVHHTQSAVLLHELVHFLLGADTPREHPSDTPPHTHMLRYHLIKHCDHISDEVSDNDSSLMRYVFSSVLRQILKLS